MFKGKCVCACTNSSSPSFSFSSSSSMASHPKASLNEASKFGCLDVFFYCFSLQNLSTAYFHCINPALPWISYRPLSNIVAFQNPFGYAISIHTPDVTACREKGKFVHVLN
jgi:hypothetical protein